MIRKKQVWMMILSAVICLSGCGVSEKGSVEGTGVGEKAVQHVWGGTTIRGTPKRVVALDFFVVDIMCSLGLSPTGIAGADQIKIPPYLKNRMKSFTDVGERKEPNLEVIYSIQPDLIVANPERAKLIKQDLQQIAPTIALGDHSIRQILENMDLLGEIFGKQKEARKAKMDLEKKINSARKMVKNQPTVLVVGAFEDDYSVWIRDSFIGTLFSEIGMAYIFEGGKSNTEGKADIAQTSLERIAQMNPDYLFVYGSDVQKMKKNPLFRDLKAVKTGRVVEVDRDIWARGRGPIAAGLILDQVISMLESQTAAKARS